MVTFFTIHQTVNEGKKALAFGSCRDNKGTIFSYGGYVHVVVIPMIHLDFHGNEKKNGRHMNREKTEIVILRGVFC